MSSFLINMDILKRDGLYGNLVWEDIESQQFSFI